jgi:glycosyltransferase involved in cell wall biosynthesis
VTPRVSVVVPVRNAAGSIGGLLVSLAAQTLPAGSWEVVVVDDRSDDRTRDIVRATPGVRLIESRAQAGSYVARNRGARAARAPVLAFTDADCEPDPTWLERGLAAVEDGDGTIIAGHIEVPLGATPTHAAMVDFVRFLNQAAYAATGRAATANLWLRTDTIRRLGGFNERLRSGGDFELVGRAVAAGEVLRYRPDVIVAHQPRRRLRDLARKGYRIGYANAVHQDHAAGPLRDAPRLCAHLGNYLPRRRLYDLDRLEGRGLRLTPGRLAMLHATQYVGLQVPMVAGSLLGTLRASAGARARGSSTSPMRSSGETL